MSALINVCVTSDDTNRRRVLAESDALLDRVEELRLADQPVCPPALAEAIRSLQLRIGRIDAHHPRTLGAAHRLVLAVQARLLAANPRNPRPATQLDRPAGQPTVMALRQGGAWKFLALPPRPPSTEAKAQAEWRLLVELTVQRALDRWVCAQDEAVSAARKGDSAARAVARACAAWRNYWDLRCEAERLLRPGQLGGARVAPAGGLSAPSGASRAALPL